MPNPPPFIIHHTPGSKPWVNPGGGNGTYIGQVKLRWKSVGTAPPFTLRFHEYPSGPEGWPFQGPEPSWPVSDCEADWQALKDGRYKYDVVIEGFEKDPLDPMLVFDRVQRRMPILIAVAAISAVIGFVIGLAF